MVPEKKVQNRRRRIMKQVKVWSVKNLDPYRLCPSCGNFSGIGENHQFCTVCGEKLIEACLKCGEPIHYPTAKFCPKCGEGYKISEE